MPRFFFHLRSAGKSLVDCEGTLLADADTACRHAGLMIQDFFQPAGGRVHPEWEHWSVDVADQRGRCLLSLAFADAAELENPKLMPRPDERRSNCVVYLDIERARREFALVENEIRRAISRTAMLLDRTRYEASGLHGLLRTTGEIRQESADLLARSRRQTETADWLLMDGRAHQTHEVTPKRFDRAGR